MHHPSDVTLRPYPSPGPTVINVPFLRSYGGPRKKKNKAESHKGTPRQTKKHTGEDKSRVDPRNDRYNDQSRPLRFRREGGFRVARRAQGMAPPAHNTRTRALWKARPARSLGPVGRIDAPLLCSAGGRKGAAARCLFDRFTVPPRRAKARRVRKIGRACVFFLLATPESTRKNTGSVSRPRSETEISPWSKATGRRPTSGCHVITPRGRGPLAVDTTPAHCLHLI